MNYPRMLFPAGDPSQSGKVVLSAAEEADARESGYRIAYEAAESAPPKPAKPQKAK